MDAGDGERCGFGWFITADHHRYVGFSLKGSTNDSFAVLQMIRSEKIAVAVIANTGTTVSFEIVEKILRDLLPHYRATLANEKPSAPARDASSVTSNALVGSWTGALQTWKGNIPLAVEISLSHQVRAKWAKDQWITASDVEIKDLYEKQTGGSVCESTWGDTVTPKALWLRVQQPPTGPGGTGVPSYRRYRTRLWWNVFLVSDACEPTPAP